jgi:hypothetical protein
MRTIRQFHHPSAPIHRLAVLTLVLAPACGGGDEPPPCDPSRAVSMAVSYGNESEAVDLGTLQGTEDGDLCLVPLMDVVDAAGLGFDPEASYYDFMASDGFRPTQVDCVTVDATTLELGWVDRVTGTLVWDESLGLRGCYSVTKAVEIAAYDAPWPLVE